VRSLEPRGREGEGLRHGADGEGGEPDWRGWSPSNLSVYHGFGGSLLFVAPSGLTDGVGELGKFVASQS